MISQGLQRNGFSFKRETCVSVQLFDNSSKEVMNNIKYII